MSLEGFTEYKAREFCNDVKCPVQTQLNTLKDKPEEYERLAANGELEKNLVEPLPDVVMKAVRFFAWTALGIGISMVIWIIYAMLFAYK